MTRVRIDLAYDGGPFSGFARQRDRTTVQGTLEGALSRALGFDVYSVCAGRTDAGVHAIAQVVHFDVEPVERGPKWLAHLQEDPAEATFRLDHQVGAEITIWGIRPVSRNFNARFGATERRYRYRIVDGSPIDPRDRGRVFRVRERLHVPSMREAATHLLGAHDFAAFCRKPKVGHTKRRLDRVTIQRVGDEVHVGFRSKAFCHQMVRSMVGCLYEVGRGAAEPAWVGEVLAGGDRSLAAAVAPPHGLTLERVSYGQRFPAAPWR